MNGKGDKYRPVGKDYAIREAKIIGNRCFNDDCEYWADYRIRLNCLLYNGDLKKVKSCPDRKLKSQ